MYAENGLDRSYVFRATKTVPYIQSIVTSIGENRYCWRGQAPSNRAFIKLYKFQIRGSDQKQLVQN